MVEFGSSVVRLADIARHSGRAADAVAELWPLITRLEARVHTGQADLAIMRLLAQARASLGTALGNLLPDERLATAARWTGRALRTAWDLGDKDLLASVLRMHGNELCKAGHPAAATVRLRQALQADDRPAQRGATLVLLARAASESGQPDMFDAVAEECLRMIASPAPGEVLFSSFTIREALLRGLLATGRAAQAARLAERYPPGDSPPPTPQWRVIERITTAQVLANSGSHQTSMTMLSHAIKDAEILRLPHQVQRVIRIAGDEGTSHNPALREQAVTALTRINGQLAATSPSADPLGTPPNDLPHIDTAVKATADLPPD